MASVFGNVFGSSASGTGATAAEIAAAVWAESTRTLTSGGGGGDATASKQDEILAKFASTALISQPVTTSGEITAAVVIGDDYLANNGRAFTWTIDAPTGATAASSSCSLGFTHKYNDGLLVGGTVADIGGGQWKLTFELTKEQTGAMVEGGYDWSVEVSDDAGAELTQVLPDKSKCAEFVKKST